MEWKKMNKNEAYDDYQRIIVNGTAKCECDDSYFELRNELEKAYFDLSQLCKIENGEVLDKYKFDCYFGLKLYEILSTPKFYLREHDATNDAIWKYIQIHVIPDIVKSRVGNNDDAFYKKSNRLYLKRIWWYIHLSMYNGELQNAQSIILDSCNSTDTILQLVDRCGRQGYRVELYREIMKYKSLYKVSGDKFRNLLILNNAKVKVVDPYLVNGGIEEYVKKLIGEIL